MKPKLNSILKTLFFLIVLPFILLALKTILDSRKKASSDNANIQIQTNQINQELNSDFWLNFSQGGEEATDMIRPVIGHIYPLKPSLIRFDHPFDNYKVYRGPNDYNFEEFDKAIDSILITGASPFICLSNFPANMDQKDWDNWSLAVTALVKHLSENKKIRHPLYYEVLNEPDLFGGWHYSKDPNYIKLYKKTADAVALGAGNTPYKIGGPATTAYYPNWMKSLFDNIKSKDIRLDFVSWHNYSRDINKYLSDSSRYLELLSNYPQFADTETLITEIGPDSEKDDWYNNKNSGIHLLSLITRFYGQVNRIFSFELVDGPNQNNGWGIIHHTDQQTKLKPRYQAFRFINQLIPGRRLTSSGDNYYISSISVRNRETIKTLLVNYDSNNIHVENVPVTFNQLDPGSYLLTISQFEGPQIKQNITVESSTHTENIFMEPNTASLIELVKN